MALDSRGSPSFGSQPMDCNSFNPLYPDSDFTLHASCRCDLVSIPSAIGDLKEADSLGSTSNEYQFPSLQDARKVSFKAKSGIRASRVFDDFSISPATPVFQSDFCREVVGANQSVKNEMACVNINPTIGSTVIPDMESKQKGDSITGGGESSVMRCNEELDPDGRACCLEAANFNPVEVLHGLESKLQIKSVGSEMRPSEGSSTRPLHQADLMEGINPVAQGVMVECPPEVSHRGMIQLPFCREGDVTGSKDSLGLPIELAGGMTGASWSSVVTKNTPGGHDTMEVDHSSLWLMILL